MSAMPFIMDLTRQNLPSASEQLARQLSKAAVVRAQEPLARRTTLRVGGPADLYVEPANENDLAETLRWCQLQHLPVFVLGRGSNLLIRDGGIRGVVISLAHPNFSELVIEGERIRCGAGVKLKQVAVEARRAGLSGVEFLEGIPGSVGGALRMNAGAMGNETFNAVESIRVMSLDGATHDLPAREVKVSYRGCALLKNHLALGAVFKCTAATLEQVTERMAQFSKKRWSSQPAAPSAGCCFKNPDEIPAGRLVEELGLKGTKVGGAMVSFEHGNFITNDGSATAQNILDLIELVQARAKSTRGITLQTEVEIVGED